jgi:pimeloyl-ACP methyl ester carboxylesterase
MTPPNPWNRITRRSAMAGVAAAITGGSGVLAQGFPAGAVRTVAGRVKLPDGRCVGYADFGFESGPLVLYFHGTPGSRLEAALIAEEALACGVRLVGVDRPGIGLSTHVPGRRILDWPADALCVAAALGYSTGAIGVMGCSGGAPYALACLKCAPERLGHVAVVSGHTPMDEPGAGRGNQDRLIEFIARRPRLAHIGIGVIIRRLHRRPDAVLARVGSEAAASDRKLLLDDPVNRAGFHQSLLAATSGGPAPIVTDVRLLASHWGYRLAELPPASVSIWQGGCDPIAPPAMGHFFHRNVAGSELAVDEVAGHATMLKWHAREILSRFA